MKTLTTKSWNGKEITLTRAEFVKRWDATTHDLTSLSMDHYEELLQMRNRINVIAGEEFDRLTADVEEVEAQS